MGQPPNNNFHPASRSGVGSFWQRCTRIWRKVFRAEDKGWKTLGRIKSASFGKLQNLARVIVLPVAVLPLAGLLLGVGGAFAQFGHLKHWSSGAIAPFSVMREAGQLVFTLLGLLFAIAIAFGYAQHSKGIAALTGFVAFIVATSVVYGMFLPYSVKGDDNIIHIHVGFDPWHLTDDGIITESVKAKGFFNNILGLNPTFDLSVFGGILIGAGVAYIHNHTYNIRLPKVLAFFGGGRIVPVFGILVGIGYGIVFFFAWPALLKLFHVTGSGLGQVMGFANDTSNKGKLTGDNFHPTVAGAFVAFTFGALERLLIPTGLHHVLYSPFWFSSIGGQWHNAAGNPINGAYKIFFAQYGSNAEGHFNQYAGTVFMSGRFAFMDWGYPCAALAMYLLAKKENRPMVGGIMLSATLTSFLTGITEPMLFSFLFVAPLLYVYHAFMAGISFVMCYVLNVVVGEGFSGGIIDFTFFGILPATIGKKTGFYWILVIGACLMPAYFFGFYYITKWRDYATLGRKSAEAGGAVDVLGIVQESLRSGSKKAKPIGQVLFEGLGMQVNIVKYEVHGTMITVHVRDCSKVSEGMLRLTGTKFIKMNEDQKTVAIRYLTGAPQMLNDLHEYVVGKRKLFVPPAPPKMKQRQQAPSVDGKTDLPLARARKIYEGLGGKANITVLSSCATRLRVTVRDINLVNRDLLKTTGSMGVFVSGNNIQVIYGPEVVNIIADMEKV